MPKASFTVLKEVSEKYPQNFGKNSGEKDTREATI
jgi:hypothetical protein